jgi:hypothetical protein
MQVRLLYSGCQKNVPIAERFFATTLMPPSFFRNINMTSGINSSMAMLVQQLQTTAEMQLEMLKNAAESQQQMVKMLAAAGVGENVDVTA